MSYSKYEFQRGTATIDAITTHLWMCSDSFIPPLNTYVKIEDYARKIFDNAITFEAWHREELIGLGAAYFNDIERKRGFITNLSVLNKHQRSGIATILLQQMVHYAMGHTFFRLDLEVHADNTPAYEFYIKGKFDLIARIGNKYKMSRVLVTETPNER